MKTVDAESKIEAHKSRLGKRARTCNVTFCYPPCLFGERTLRSVTVENFIESNRVVDPVERAIFKIGSIKFEERQRYRYDARGRQNGAINKLERKPYGRKLPYTFDSEKC